MSFCKARDWSVRSGSDRSAKRWDALVLVSVVLGGCGMVDSMVVLCHVRMPMRM